MEELTQKEMIARVRFALSFRAGKDNRISRQELVRKVFGAWALNDQSNNNRFDRMIRQAIEDLREEMLICSSSGTDGYWLAETLQDVEEIAGEYERRSKSMLTKASLIRKRGIERLGPQLPMPGMR